MTQIRGNRVPQTKYETAPLAHWDILLSQLLRGPPLCTGGPPMHIGEQLQKPLWVLSSRADIPEG